MQSQTVTANQASVNDPSASDTCYKRDKRENALSKAQRQAIHLLLAGHTDRHVAKAVGVYRTTVTRWRIYHPTFQTELNRRRQALFTNNADRLRALMSRALKVLHKHLDSATERASFRAAVSILRLGGLARLPAPSGPVDEYDLLKEYMKDRHHENRRFGKEQVFWPPEKQDLDELREYFVKKANNVPLTASSSDPALIRQAKERLRDWVDPDAMVEPLEPAGPTESR